MKLEKKHYIGIGIIIIILLIIIFRKPIGRFFHLEAKSDTKRTTGGGNFKWPHIGVFPCSWSTWDHPQKCFGIRF